MVEIKFKDPFILGLQPVIRNYPFLSSEELYAKSGLNLGNFVFHFAIDQHLGGNLKQIHWSAPPETISNQGDIAIIPCANQLGSHVDMHEKLLKVSDWSKIRVPMVAIGLGAQSDINGTIPMVPRGTLKWVKIISDHAPFDYPNISVRGEFSLRVLEHYGLSDNAVVLGCPSLFINPAPNLGAIIEKNIKDPKRVAVCDAVFDRKLRYIERSLIKIVTDTKGCYIIQSHLDKIRLARGESSKLKPENLIAIRNFLAPEMDTSEIIDWFKTYGIVFFDTQAWLEYYKNFDFVVGTRFHGIVLAIQAGIPALCIVHDSRTLELCETSHIPYARYNELESKRITLDVLFNIFLERFNPKIFDKNRKHLAKRYIEFLKNNGLEPVLWLKELAKGKTEIIGHIDRVNYTSGKIVLSGWIADRQKRILKLEPRNTRDKVEVKYGIKRKDVANALNISHAINSGFFITVPLDTQKVKLELVYEDNTNVEVTIDVANKKIVPHI